MVKYNIRVYISKKHIENFLQIKIIEKRIREWTRIFLTGLMK